MPVTGVRRIAFSSTGSVYGEPNVFPTPEDAPFPIQTSLYGASKLAAEGLIQAYCEGFGFQGYMTSDCDAIYIMQNRHNWKPDGVTAVTATTRHAWALAAGEDLDCNTGYKDSNNYGNQLVNVVNAHITTTTGLVTENQVDTSLERLFTARMRLGEFDNGGNDVPWVQQARTRVPQGSWQNNESNMAVTETVLPDRPSRGCKATRTYPPRPARKPRRRSCRPRSYAPSARG